MGPVPNPVPSGGLSDEEMPQHPPIFLSSSDEDDEETLQDNDYPPGYMPITHFMEVQWPDSDDNDDSVDYVPTSPVRNEDSTTENSSPDVVSPSTTATNDGAADIDYDSLAGLMQALRSNGPTQVDESCGLDGVYSDATEGGSRPTQPTNSSQQRVDEAPSIQRVYPSITPSSFNIEPLAADQEAAVKQAMLGFILPQSAIPAWAENLSDTDLTGLVKKKITDTDT